MARDKDQIFIFNEAELKLIKTVFADNDVLLYAIRKVLLQFPLSEVERNLLKLQITPEVHSVLKKRMLPDISDDFPLTQLADVMTTLNQDIKTKTPEEMVPLFNAKLLENQYLTERFEALADVSVEKESTVVLKELRNIKGKDADEVFVNMTAYLFLLGYIDPMLMLVRNIAGAKDETPEEQVARMRRDSNK